MITVQLSEGPAGYIADPQGLLAQTNEIGQSQKDCISYPPPPHARPVIRLRSRP